MKILFVSPVGALFSGAEIAIVNLMQFLSQQGHEIYNVIPDNLSKKDDKYIKMMQAADIHLYQLSTLKWWWQESTTLYESNVDAVKAYQHKNIAEIREIIREKNIELVISNTVNVFQGALAAACEQVPHYYIIHEFPFGEFGYYKEKIALIDQLSDKIFAVEGALYKTLLDYFSSEKLIPFIPYTNAKVQQLSKGTRNRIVSIGGITDRKNQLELIKAYRQLGQFDYELVFIGSGDKNYIQECEEYIHHHQLTNISFLGYQSNPWELITDKDILVLPSKLESFSLVFVESILNGVPSIVSDNLGHQSSGKYFNAGFLYALGDIDQLVLLLSETLQHFESRKLEAEKIKEKARMLYTLENVSSIFLEKITISESSKEKESLSSLQSLFGWSLEKDLLELIRGNEVTVYFSDEKGEYSPLRKLSYPLRNSDCFEISIKDTKSIRIDLTEHPSIFTNVLLKTEENNQELPPSLYKGYFREDKMIFYGKDHHIEYDLQTVQADTVIFSYSKESNDFYGEFLGQELTEAQAKLDILEPAYGQIKSEYDTLYHQYNGVIHSRRWTIPTKIINFFRRNK